MEIPFHVLLLIHWPMASTISFFMVGEYEVSCALISMLQKNDRDISGLGDLVSCLLFNILSFSWNFHGTFIISTA